MTQERKAAATRDGEPTAHVAMARLLLAAFGAEGCDERALAREAALSPDMLADNAVRIPSDRITSLWRAGLVATGDPGLGIKVADRWWAGSLQLADYLFDTAPTLADAIVGVKSFSGLLNTANNEIDLNREQDGSGKLTYQVRSGHADVDAVASQFALAMILRRARHSLRHEVRPVRLRLSSAAPVDPRELAAELGATQIEFGAERSSMTLTSTDLARPMPGGDRWLRAVLQRAAGQLLRTPGGTWIDDVREVVAAHLTDQDLSLATVAQGLALSPRTLQRRLETEGTTWRGVLDGVRRELARQLLDEGLATTAVALRVGFQDARALRSARQRWAAQGWAAQGWAAQG